ncbi:MAG TPA: VC0807 family protein [Acidimicrobiales bacterium]|jgi:hypothetical protein|nr:VC0807 family protein [Acidimicrobiales bacterium]
MGIVDRLRTEDVTIDALPPPPTVRSVLERFGRKFVTDSIIPFALFLGLNSWVGLGWAMVAGTIWSIGLIVVRRRRGEAAGALVWISLCFVLVRGAAGLLTSSGTVYFGPGVATNFLVALAFVVSVLVRRPLVGYIALVFYPFPDEIRSHDAYRRAFSRLSLAWAALLVATGTAQGVALLTASTNQFLLVRSAGWPFTAGLFVFSLGYPRRCFKRDPELGPWVLAAEGAGG